jgi:hypothetical protein
MLSRQVAGLFAMPQATKDNSEPDLPEMKMQPSRPPISSQRVTRDMRMRMPMPGPGAGASVAWDEIEGDRIGCRRLPAASG